MPAEAQFTFRMWAVDERERTRANELVLEFKDDPPPWVATDADISFTIGYVPTPRSKARTSHTRTLTDQRLRNVLAKERPGEDFSIGFDYLDSARNTVTFLSVGWAPTFSFEVVPLPLPSAALHDPAFGRWVARAARRVIERIPQLEPAAVWFGGTARHPCTFDDHAPGVLPGYGWAMTFPPDILAKVGGVDALHRAPAEIVEVAIDPDGQHTAIVVLAAAPVDVTEGQLRSWKNVLAPALPPRRRTERAHMFHRAIATHPWQYDRPPLLLAEDWPDPPDDPRYFPPDRGSLL